MQETEKEQETAHEMIRKEINFLQYPYFALSTKGLKNKQRSEVHRVIRQGDEKLEIYWKVNAHPDYGYPGPFARKVNMTVERIISQMPLPIANPIPLGSWYEFCRLMKVPANGWHYAGIKKAILRMMTTTVESKHTYYHKGKRRWLSDAFHLYDRLISKGEELDDGTIAEANYLYLNSWYIENINARYAKLLDYEYNQSLSSAVASRLHELLGLKFYRLANESRIQYIQYLYSTVCSLLPITRQEYFSLARQILDHAHEYLLRTKFLAKFEWIPVPGAKNDWYLKYWPGHRYYNEVSRLNNGHKVFPAPGDACNPDVPDMSEVIDIDIARDDESLLEEQRAFPFLNNSESQEAFDSRNESTEVPKNLVESRQPDLSQNERYLLALLKSIPGYPFKYEKDLGVIRDLLIDFPTLDLGDEIKDWKTWLMDNNLKKNVNFRSRLRRWLKNSKRYMEERHGTDYDPSRYADAVWEDPARERAGC
ncbi:MAG: hypothetical protein WAL98_05455 [Desulfatiglandaceae bacterium]